MAVNYMGRSCFWNSTDKKNYMIDFRDANDTLVFSAGNSKLVAESFEMTEKLTSDGKLKFGGCTSTMVTFQIGNTAPPLVGTNMILHLQFGTHLLDPTIWLWGIYKVVSDVPTADRKFRKITAYDALQEVLQMDVTDWYDTLFPTADTMVTVKDFRDSFFQYVGLTQETTTLINDALYVGKAEGVTQLSGATVLNKLCEINMCFGHVCRPPSLSSSDIKFKYVSLADPSQDTPYEIPVYREAKYEDYETTAFTKVIIRSEENTIGVAAGQDGGSVYEICQNFLTYKMSWADFSACATNALAAIQGVNFRPAQIETQGDPCMEVGDMIKLVTTNCTIVTYAMQRKLKGLQWLRDSIKAVGDKVVEENPNSTSAKINKITGRINEIKADLVTAINVNAQNITAINGRLQYVEANYITAGTVAANYATIGDLNAVSGRVGTLEATAITTANLSAQSISAGQINSGTIDTARLNVGQIAAQTVTASNICGALSSPGQGTITIGTIRVSSYQYFTGVGYETLSLQTVTIGSHTYRLLGIY